MDSRENALPRDINESEGSENVFENVNLYGKSCEQPNSERYLVSSGSPVSKGSSKQKAWIAEPLVQQNYKIALEASKYAQEMSTISSMDNDEALHSRNASIAHLSANDGYANFRSASIGASSRYQRPTTRESATKYAKILVPALIVLILVGVLMGVTLRESHEADTCYSGHCVGISKTMLANINKKIDPCENFYEFTCGNWITDNPVPDSTISLSQYDKLNQNTSQIMKMIYEKTYEADDTLTPTEQEMDQALFIKMKSYYSSCMNQASINLAASTPMEKLIAKIYVDEMEGKWSNETEPRVVGSSLAKAHRRQVQIVFQSSVDDDMKNSSANIFWLWNVDIYRPLLMKQFYYQDKIMTSYRAAALSLFNSFIRPVIDPSMDSDEATRLVDEMLDFEMKLMNISKTRDDILIESKMYNNRTVDQVKELLTFMDWDEFVKNLFAQADISTYLTNTTTMSLDVPEFFEQISSVIQPNNLEAFQTYILFCHVTRYLYGLDEKQQEQWDPVKEALGLSKANGERHEVCVSQTDDAFGLYSSRFFIKEVEADKSRQTVQKMIENIKNAYKQRIQRASWIDDATQVKIIEKLDLMKQKVAYPDAIMNLTAMTLRHEPLHPSPSDYFGNILENEEAKLDRLIKKLFKQRDLENWEEFIPQTVNAFYTPSTNQFVMLAGILRGMFFNPHNPPYMNYGAVGSIIGHEIMHGFDANGRNYNWDGVLEDWWTQSTAQEYDEISQCFIQQYGNYSMPINSTYSKAVDGAKTLQENMADNGGVSSAYDAWKLASDSGEALNVKLSGLEKFSLEQIFFIAFGQANCANYKQASLELSMDSDVHAHQMVRVLGPLQNFDSFSDAFKCKAGSKMNPVNKCRLW